MIMKIMVAIIMPQCSAVLMAIIGLTIIVRVGALVLVTDGGMIAGIITHGTMIIILSDMDMGITTHIGMEVIMDGIIMIITGHIAMDIPTIPDRVILVRTQEDLMEVEALNQHQLPVEMQVVI